MAVIATYKYALHLRIRSLKLGEAYSMGDQQQVTVEDTFETMSTCPDKPWGPLCVIIG
jgi:hypothetical protein